MDKWLDSSQKTCAPVIWDQRVCPDMQVCFEPWLHWHTFGMVPQVTTNPRCVTVSTVLCTLVSCSVSWCTRLRLVARVRSCSFLPTLSWRSAVWWWVKIQQEDTEDIEGWKWPDWTKGATMWGCGQFAKSERTKGSSWRVVLGRTVMRMSEWDLKLMKRFVFDDDVWKSVKGKNPKGKISNVSFKVSKETTVCPSCQSEDSPADTVRQVEACRWIRAAVIP